jgi:acetyl esterase/lipase
MADKSRWWVLSALGLVAGMTTLCCCGGVAVSILRHRAAAVPATVHYQEDASYATADGEALVWDIARPAAGAGPFPAVVCIHGGGWRSGDKSAFRPFVQLLAQRGYVAVTVRYRFAPAHPFPAQLHDVKAAVRALRARAGELSVDPDRIGAMGGSAGGHLALLLATTDADDGLEGDGGHAGFSSRVQAAASIAGPVDLAQPFPQDVQFMLRDLLGGMPGEGSQAARASPLTYLTADDPPLLAVHGTQDELVPYEQATSLVEACGRVGVSARLITITGGGHGAGGNPQEWLAANEELIQFLDSCLKPGTP